MTEKRPRSPALLLRECAKQAGIKLEDGQLPASLTPDELARLQYPLDRQARNDFLRLMLKAITENELVHEIVYIKEMVPIEFLPEEYRAASPGQFVYRNGDSLPEERPPFRYDPSNARDLLRIEREKLQWPRGCCVLLQAEGEVTLIDHHATANWLNKIEEWPVECMSVWLGPEWQAEPKPAPRKDGRQTGKREKQIQALEAIARAFGYEPLDIPEGGRAAIEAHCLEHRRDQFTPDGFDHAWKEANRQGRIRIHEKERYLAR